MDCGLTVMLQYHTGFSVATLLRRVKSLMGTESLANSSWFPNMIIISLSTRKENGVTNILFMLKRSCQRYISFPFFYVIVNRRHGFRQLERELQLCSPAFHELRSVDRFIDVVLPAQSRKQLAKFRFGQDSPRNPLGIWAIQSHVLLKKKKKTASCIYNLAMGSKDVFRWSL